MNAFTLTLDPGQAALLQRYLDGNPDVAERHGVQTDSDGRLSLDHLPLDRLRSLLVEAASTRPTLFPPDSPASNAAVQELGHKLQVASGEVGVDLYAIMGLLHKMAQSSRRAARQMREADNQQRFVQLQAAADQVREAAQKDYDAAVKQAVAQIVTGVVGMAAAGVSLYGVGRAMGEESETAQKAVMTKWSAMGQLTEATGKIAAGGLGISAAEDTRAAGQAKAQEKVNEANAQRAQDAADKEKEFMQRMEETMQDIRQKLAAIQQSNDDTMRTILRA